jgi:outer membrane protein assembly factor BamE (lipoprotein component of BamABCDE complex)
MKAILLLLAMVMLGGCAYGTPLTNQRAAEVNQIYYNGGIKIGMTRAEVVELIGEPSKKITIITRKDSDVWYYSSHNVLYDTAIGSWQREIIIEFRQGKVYTVNKKLSR